MMATQSINGLKAKVILQYFRSRQHDPVSYQPQILNNLKIIPRYLGLQLVKAILAIVLPLISNLDTGILKQTKA